MSTEDVDRWLEALAGREQGGDSEEGRALRAQILAQQPETLAAVAEIDSAREAQLIARARGRLAAFRELEPTASPRQDSKALGTAAHCSDCGVTRGSRDRCDHAAIHDDPDRDLPRRGQRCGGT